jgi:mono/diheme cytochrome c family protein
MLELRAAFVAALAALVLMAAMPGLAHASDDGGALYHRHCERCHGVTGRGDGPDAELLATPPRDLQSGFLQRYSTVDLVRRIRKGLPLEIALDLPALRARARDVEALAAYLERLPTVTRRKVEEGQALYLDHCELCHGVYGAPDLTIAGDARRPRDLGDPNVQREVSDADLEDVMRHGHRGMPAPGPIVAQERPSVIAFVRLLSPGYALYDRYCATCHGDDGRGSGSFVEEGRRPSVVFDRAYFRARNPEHVRASIWHMLDTERPSMPHLRDTVTESEARAIVEYLKRAP